jgi:hypothetical protein
MRSALFLSFFLIFSISALAENPTIQDLKAQIDQLKQEYEKRIQELEQKVEQLQIQALQAPEPEAAAPAAQPVQQVPGILNPAISVVGNFVGRADDQVVLNDAGQQIDDKLNLREAELDFRVPVDPYADGVLIAAIESEFPGEFDTGIEEGYVNIKKLPWISQNPLGLKIKAGRFRPMFGKINVLHIHDLPTTFHPLPIQEFLGEEGFVQQGVSTNFYIPTPWDASASLDATLEVMDGGDIALSPQQDARISYLGHVRYFRTFAGGNDVELGWSSYFHPSSDEVGAATLHGIDFLYRWKPFRQGQYRSFLFGTEYMFAPDTTVAEVEPANTPKGFTAFSQWQFSNRIYAGLRYDHTDVLLNPDLQRQSMTPYLSYYFSEFLRLRLSYEHRWSDLADEDGRNSLFLELNWIFGSHPPEPFWVNK